MKEKTKGVLFTLMVFYLCLLIISLTQTKNNLRLIEKENQSIVQEIKKVQEMFSDESNGLIELPLSKQSSSTSSRFLPFSYEIDKNKAYFEINLPNKAKIVDYLEKINSFSVLYESKEKKPNNAVHIDINTPKPESWGGNAKSVKFKIEPECAALFLDNNFFMFENNCNKISRIDINLLVDNSQDFNSLTCSFDNNSDCPMNEYEPNQELPYAKITILDENCDNCTIQQKQIFGFFDTTKENYLELNCVGNCVSKPVKISLKQNIVTETNGRIITKTLIDFKDEIEKVINSDANVSVSTNRVRVWKRQ